jgi:hypothetical protein
MPFKNDYIQNEQISQQSYEDADAARNRIRRFYQSAGKIVRRGVTLSDAATAELWKRFFEPLNHRLNQLPLIQSEYDLFALQEISTLGRLLRELDLLQHGQLGDFGIAQKMLNLFMKDHWALNAFSIETERLLHLPLDRRVLEKLRRRPATWRNWTRAMDTPEHRRDYQRIQAWFRFECERVRIYRSPIEMEQFIWYRFKGRMPTSTSSG